MSHSGASGRASRRRAVISTHHEAMVGLEVVLDENGKALLGNVLGRRGEEKVGQQRLGKLLFLKGVRKGKANGEATARKAAWRPPALRLRTVARSMSSARTPRLSQML